MKLTKREREILCLAHYPIEEIGNILNIKVTTVRAHIVNIMVKFTFCNNRHECQIQALKEGLITLEEIVMEDNLYSSY